MGEVSQAGHKEMESLLFLFFVWPSVCIIQLDILKPLKVFSNEPMASETEWEDT